MRQLAGYVLEETIYEGLETRVRRATHLLSGQKLVVKLPVLDPPSLRTVGRLVYEYQILGKLAAISGVVRAQALLQDSGSVALVLEDPGLRSLDRVLAERGRLPLAEALKVALALCRILAEIHAAGIVHKDVKPQNILVDADCTKAVLIDFGIASELAQEAIEARFAESLEGTLAYISPEQTGRTARELDSRTDLYSLGVTLFELISGQRPFQEKDALALVYAHLAKTPPALNSLLPEVPSTIGLILNRCLEKTPEKRYQTANGLAYDLALCLEDWQKQGKIEPFGIGQRDFSPKLQIPQALISREEESQAIAAAFERAKSGSVELLLLGGQSGVGKTALVRSVYREIAKTGRGLLLSGKYDKLGRAVPYTALTQAFSSLLGSLAASPKPVFEAWRQHLDQALGPLARVIADLVPELTWLLGPISSVPVVPTEMAYNRLKLSWIDFVRAITDASPPLVLFLDDMQWVDPASLELLKTLLTDVGRKHLLVIAAYRDSEVDATHPLWKLVEAVEQSGVPAPRLNLGPLSEAAVQKWLADTLLADFARVAPLAAALFRRTQGNPFFLGQLLLELYRRKQLQRNLEDGTWHWNHEAIEQAAVTNNVLELLLHKVEELPGPTQTLLGQAACAGHSFLFRELAVLTGRPHSQIAEELRPALLAGLVIPIDGQYREAQALAQAQQSDGLDAGYRFLHDRVQQAFYERIAPEQREQTHLQIGRRFLNIFEQQGGSNQKLLELTRHLNLGSAALQTATERKELARLNLKGAKAAKENASYELQAALLEQGQRLLGERAWQEEPALMVELALERLEADYMLRDFDMLHRRAQEFLALPLPALPRLVAQELRARTCVASGQYGEGERLGLLALAEQGINYPESNEECIVQTLSGIGECDAWLDRNPQGFHSMPADPSLEHLLCDALQAALLASAAIGSRPVLAALVMVRNTQQTINKAAFTLVAPFFVGALATGRSAFLGDYRGDVRWAQEGLSAAQRLASPFLPECLYIRGYHGVYESPVEQTRQYYQEALRVARSSGSFQGTSCALYAELYYVDLWSGRPLDQVAAAEAAQRDLMARSGVAVGRHHFALAASYAVFLRASSQVLVASCAEWLPINSRSLLEKGDGVVAELARIQEAHLFLAFGEYGRAHERAEEAEIFRPAIYGLPPVTDVPLWRGLAAAKCCTLELDREKRARLLATLEHSIERFRYFAAGCAENFRHKLCLLEAEQARLLGQSEVAMRKYEEAISLAKKERFLHIEALAAEFYAQFHLQAGHDCSAALYLSVARTAYTRWNAFALVHFLEQKYSALLSIPVSIGLSAASTRTTTTMTSTTGDVAIDVNTVVRAAQTLAGQLDLERVIAELMRLVQQNSGAQQAALLLCADEKLSVAALLSGSEVHAGRVIPLSAAHPVASSVVQYVLRSREALVLNDATADNRFAKDPHLEAAAIYSVLAMPLMHQGRLGGILYIEHASANAFPEARMHLLGVLAAQGAIALENARLYAELQSANIGLEAKVKERTAALDKALKDLWSEMDLAQKIQTVLLPSELQIAGYDLAAMMRPADQVGGDYYDVFRQGKQDWVVIGDVSGHGVSAGLCMMMIQSVLRAVALTLERQSHDRLAPRSLLGLVNEAVERNLKQIGRGQYMTITALSIEAGKVRYAGLHQDLLIYRAASKQVECIPTEGIWLGVAEGDISELLRDDELALEPGDVLLLYTDGYTEAKIGERRVEIGGLRTVFAELCDQSLPSAALLSGLFESLKPAAVHDDVTLVALRRLSYKLPAPENG